MTLARATCRDCQRDHVSAEQVERWPHLARYAVGDLDENGRCERCAYAAARNAAKTRANRERRKGRLVVVDALNRLVDHEDLLADWEVLRDAGTDLSSAAGRLHLSHHALVSVLAAARLRGDERGALEPYARDLPRTPRRTLRLGRTLVDA